MDNSKYIKRKVLVCYDFFHCEGGAEIVTRYLAQALEGADICVAYNSLETYRFNEGKLKCLGNKPNFLGSKYLTPFLVMARFLRTNLPSRYNITVYSGYYSLFSILRNRNRKNSLSIYYCHTPPRFAYDFYDEMIGNFPFYLKPAFWFVAKIVRALYKKSLSRMDIVLANSKNVQGRLQKYLNKRSTVVYPPIDVSPIEKQSSTQRTVGEYYLSMSRLEPHKRVKMVIEAFMKMPTKRLIVMSGGSQYNELKELAKGYSNIQFTGWVSKNEKQALINNCIASIYIPIDEDFGISPLESMAKGKPVIGVNEGGLTETVIHGATGYLLNPGFYSKDLINSVSNLGASESLAMYDACVDQAKEFTYSCFKRRLLESCFS